MLPWATTGVAGLLHQRPVVQQMLLKIEGVNLCCEALGTLVPCRNVSDRRGSRQPKGPPGILEQPVQVHCASSCGGANSRERFLALAAPRLHLLRKRVRHSLQVRRRLPLESGWPQTRQAAMTQYSKRNHPQ